MPLDTCAPVFWYGTSNIHRVPPKRGSKISRTDQTPGIAKPKSHEVEAFNTTVNSKLGTAPHPHALVKFGISNDNICEVYWGEVKIHMPNINHYQGPRPKPTRPTLDRPLALRALRVPDGASVAGWPFCRCRRARLPRQEARGPAEGGISSPLKDIEPHSQALVKTRRSKLSTIVLASSASMPHDMVPTT